MRPSSKQGVASGYGQTLLERLRKDCQDEKTAAGAAGSDGGVNGKLKFSSSSDTPDGDAGSSNPDALADVLNWQAQNQLNMITVH